MSNSDTISAVSAASGTPVAVWSQVDANNAKVLLNGNVNVYTLGGVWSQIRDSQDAWLKQGDSKSKSLTFDASKVTFLDGAGIAFLIGVEEVQTTSGVSVNGVALYAVYTGYYF